MSGLEIIEYGGEGYDPSFNSDGWRVAFLNYGEENAQGKITYLERHLLTDEVFILVSGSAKMLIGENGTEIDMEKNKLYVVKKGVWHNVAMSKDAKFIIVENHSTSKENSEYMDFSR